MRTVLGTHFNFTQKIMHNFQFLFIQTNRMIFSSYLYRQIVRFCVLIFMQTNRLILCPYFYADKSSDFIGKKNCANGAIMSLLLNTNYSSLLKQTEMSTYACALMCMHMHSHATSWQECMWVHPKCITCVLMCMQMHADACRCDPMKECIQSALHMHSSVIICTLMHSHALMCN